MNFINYKPKWKKFNNSKENLINKNKKISIKSTNFVYDVKKKLDNEFYLFKNFYFEKYNENCNIYSILKNENLLNLFQFDEIIIDIGNIEEICEILYESNLYHYIKLLLSNYKEYLTPYSVSLLYDLINKYCSDSDIYNDIYKYIIDHSYILLKRYVIPYISYDIINIIYCYNDEIYLHSEKMLCEMLFEWYSINSVNCSIISSFNNILKPLLENINWNVLSLDNINDIMRLYIKNNYIINCSMKYITELSNNPKRLFTNRHMIGINYYDVFRRTYDVTEKDFVVECSSCPEHSMFYTTSIYIYI